MKVDLAIVDARVATLTDTGHAYGLIDDAIIGIRSDTIEFVGPAAEIPVEAEQTWSAGGRLVTPGLVDCHTHLVFAGERVGDFERRLAGASYAELAAAGGGILASVAATRATDEGTLLRGARRRLGWLMASGATTVEVKSGYGLELETELRMLRVARRLEGCAAVHITTSLLAAHTVPPEFAGRPDAYIDHVCEAILPAAARQGLCDAVDAFCEGIAFSPAQVARVFEAAARLNLPVKLHAEQLSDRGGARLAAQHQALSVDHLEHLGPDGAAALAEAGTTAVLLPGASAFLDESIRPPTGLLREHGVPMAIATDLNPGSAPLGSLTLAMNLACTRFGLRPEEALAGTTWVAARALGLERVGRIAPGFRADLAIWDAEHPAELCYWFGVELCQARVVGGALVTGGSDG